MKTMGRHPMPRDLFVSLARGDADAEAVRHLAAAQHSKHITLLHGVFRSARQDAPLAAQGHRLLAEVQRNEPAAAEAVIRYPSVGAWALRTLRGDRTIPGAEPGWLNAVAAAAAIKARLPAQIEVPVYNGHVVLPSLGAVAVSGRTAEVRSHPAEVCSAGQRVTLGDDTSGWERLRQVRAGSLSVLIDDLDPFRMPAADELAPRLSDAEVADLSAEIHGAWPILDPATAAEVAAAVRVLIPCQTPPRGHTSSSSPETFGAVAMSRQPDRYTYAVTLVHEVQHLKLNGLLDLVSLTRPDDGGRYYAPWRADPRPVSGLLQGAYAFLGVSRFWRRQSRVADDAAVRQRAEAEFARWRAASAQVTRTLWSSGRLTDAGQDFVSEMRQVLDVWQREPVSQQAVATAHRTAGEHLARWEADNGAAAT
jgi:uncharacterized protein